MFSLDQKVVYPGHGVAHITGIVMKPISGNTTEEKFYELSFLHKVMTILVPVHKATEIGLRSLSSTQDIHDIFQKIEMQDKKKLSPLDFNASSWNRRHKEYQLQLRSGTLLELSCVYRDLKAIETVKKLSFGEKTILQRAEDLLIEEIRLVLPEHNAEALIHQLRTFKPRNSFSSKPQAAQVA